MSEERRIRLLLEYEGAGFAGWQRQANAPTVQQAVEEAIERLTSMPTRIGGAGRTDAGVHALGQVAAFTTASRLPILAFRRGLNALLPPSVAVVAAEETALGFDPRRDALGKLYRYAIWNTDSRTAHRRRTTWHLPRPLDVAAMQEAAQAFIGEHDFAACRAADCERQTTVRRLRRLDVHRLGHRVEISVEATAFLKNMVRILVGTLVEVGAHRREASTIPALLASRDRRLAGPTAPAHGLTLVRVDYQPRFQRSDLAAVDQGPEGAVIESPR